MRNASGSFKSQTLPGPWPAPLLPCQPHPRHHQQPAASTCGAVGAEGMDHALFYPASLLWASRLNPQGQGCCPSTGSEWSTWSGEKHAGVDSQGPAALLGLCL